MRAHRTVQCNKVFTLPGGTEDNDLWVEYVTDTDDQTYIMSTWVPSADERKAIANGENIQLCVWGSGTPPVLVRTTDVPVGAPPRSEYDIQVIKRAEELRHEHGPEYTEWITNSNPEHDPGECVDCDAYRRLERHYGR
jgi:hypothetical protein